MELPLHLSARGLLWGSLGGLCVLSTTCRRVPWLVSKGSLVVQSGPIISKLIGFRSLCFQGGVCGDVKVNDTFFFAIVYKQSSKQSHAVQSCPIS